MRNVLSYLNSEDGASAAEYALILAIIGAAIGAAMLALGTAIGSAINKATTCINNVSTETTC